MEGWKEGRIAASKNLYVIAQLHARLLLTLDPLCLLLPPTCRLPHVPFQQPMILLLLLRHNRHAVTALRVWLRLQLLRCACMHQHHPPAAALPSASTPTTACGRWYQLQQHRLTSAACPAIAPCCQVEHLGRPLVLDGGVHLHVQVVRHASSY